jgi:hypothetical protein
LEGLDDHRVDPVEFIIEGLALLFSLLRFGSFLVVVVVVAGASAAIFIIFLLFFLSFIMDRFDECGHLPEQERRAVARSAQECGGQMRAELEPLRTSSNDQRTWRFFSHRLRLACFLEFGKLWLNRSSRTSQRGHEALAAEADRRRH